MIAPHASKGSLLVKTIDAEEARARFDRLLDSAARQPVSILRNGSRVAVVLSVDVFDMLTALEDTAWAWLAEESERAGFLSGEESEALLSRV